MWYKINSPTNTSFTNIHDFPNKKGFINNIQSPKISPKIAEGTVMICHNRRIINCNCGMIISASACGRSAASTMYTISRGI